MCSNDCVGFSNLGYCANLVKKTPLSELKTETEEVGVQIKKEKEDHLLKSALVVALVEHTFKEVIEPVVIALAPKLAHVKYESRIGTNYCIVLRNP